MNNFPHSFFTEPLHYRILVYGELQTNWQEYFADMSISVQNGLTNIRGKVKDQAELHGILARIRNLNLPLILVECLDYPKSNSEQSL